ncbi:MAG: DUF5017 domain-containing protein [Chitinophagaceae bacterium]
MKSIYSLLGAACLVSACSKKLTVDAPDLTVTPQSITIKLGDTAKFMFAGSAGNITFYSGEAGYKYVNKDRTSATGIPKLSFTSYAQYGTQTNTLKLLAVSGLTTLDSTSVVNAAWTDITSRATLSTGTDNTASGNIDLSDIAVSGKSMCIAYKYNGTTGSTQKTWTIKNFTVTNTLTDGAVATISGLSDAAWTAYKIKGTAAWAITSTQFQIVGGAATATTNESWVVSKPLDLTKIAPDIGVAIKSVGTASMKEYDYLYTKAGTYTATFVIFNNTIDDQKTSIQEFTITVTP